LSLNKLVISGEEAKIYYDSCTIERTNCALPTFESVLTIYTSTPEVTFSGKYRTKDKRLNIDPILHVVRGGCLASL
jgi:hypothetical protein